MVHRGEHGKKGPKKDGQHRINRATERKAVRFSVGAALLVAVIVFILLYTHGG